MWRSNLSLPIFHLHVVHSVYISYLPWLSILIRKQYDLWWPCTHSNTPGIWSTTGVFQNFVTKIRNGTFVRNLCLPCAGSICCDTLAPCIRSSVIKTYLDATTATCDSVPTKDMISFTAQIVPCSVIACIGASATVSLSPLPLYVFPVSPLVQNVWV